MRNQASISSPSPSPETQGQHPLYAAGCVIVIADTYGMRKEYLAAWKFGLEPLFALEEYDLGTIEERKMFENGCF